jgi:hypothetical protein
VGESVIDAKVAAGLLQLRDTFLAMKPLFGELIGIAKESEGHGLAFSASHLIDSIEVFQKELEKFIEREFDE